MSLLHALACVLVLVGGASQPQQKTALFIFHQEEDSVGVRFAFQLKEAVRSSSAYEVAATAQSSQFALTLQSLDTSCTRGSGNASAIAVTLFDSRTRQLIYSWILNVGADRISDSAAGLLASTDAAISNRSRN